MCYSAVASKALGHEAALSKVLGVPKVIHGFSRALGVGTSNAHIVQGSAVNFIVVLLGDIASFSLSYSSLYPKD